MAELIELIERQDATGFLAFLAADPGQSWKTMLNPTELLYASVRHGPACSDVIVTTLVDQCGAKPGEAVSEEPVFPDILANETPLHRAVLGVSREVLVFLLKGLSRMYYVRHQVVPTVVRYAVRARNSDALAVLVADDSNAVSNALDEIGKHTADEEGGEQHLEDFKYLVEHTGCVVSRAHLQRACQNGDEDLFYYLIERDSGKVDGGADLVREAARGGSVAIMQHLLRMPSQQQFVDSMGSCDDLPIHIAARMGDVAMMQLLVDAGADPTKTTRNDHWTVLHCAVEAKDDGSAAAYLLSLCPQLLDAQGENGFTALHRSVHLKHTKALRALLDAGAQVNTSSSKKWSPLHHAAYCGYQEAAALLLEHGADVDFRNDYDVSPFLRSCKSDSPGTVGAILEYGGDIDDKDKNDDTGLHYAAYTGNSQTLQYLISRGLNVNAVNKEGGTPLHDAVSKGHLETIQALYWFGAKMLASNGKGETALHIACAKYHRACAAFLVHVCPQAQHAYDSSGLLPNLPMSLEVIPEWRPENHVDQPALFREVTAVVMMLHPCSSLSILPVEIMFELFRFMF